MEMAVTLSFLKAAARGAAVSISQANTSIDGFLCLAAKAIPVTRAPPPNGTRDKNLYEKLIAQIDACNSGNAAPLLSVLYLVLHHSLVNHLKFPIQ